MSHFKTENQLSRVSLFLKLTLIQMPYSSNMRKECIFFHNERIRFVFSGPMKKKTTTPRHK